MYKIKNAISELSPENQFKLYQFLHEQLADKMTPCSSVQDDQSIVNESEYSNDQQSEEECIEDEEKQLEITDILKAPFYWILLGASGCGKSYKMNEILVDKKILDQYPASRIFIVSPNIVRDVHTKKNIIQEQKGQDGKTSYDKIINYLNSKPDFDPNDQLIGASGFKNVQRIMQMHAEENLANEGLHSLFILDDCANDLGLDNRKNYFVNMSTRGRHPNVSVIVSFQDYIALARRIRINATNISLFTLGDDIAVAMKEQKGVLSADFLQDIHKTCVDKPFGHLHIFRDKGGMKHYFDSLKGEINF